MSQMNGLRVSILIGLFKNVSCEDLSELDETEQEVKIKKIVVTHLKHDRLD